jgi:putative ABC transport system permease protein
VWPTFLSNLEKMRSVRLPLDVMTLRTFLDERDAFMASLRLLREGREKTVASMEVALKEITSGEQHAEWLGEASDQEVEAWRAIVENSGFDLPAETMRRVRDILRISLLENRISTVLQSPEMRNAWKVKFKTTPGLEDKLFMLKEQPVAELLGDRFTAEERAAVTDRFEKMKHLRSLIAKLPKVTDSVVAGPRFLDGRQVFLIGISFLVCIVGIANAMLMSITERFREIATMKCLGATDGFILKQFLIEAAIQGVVGGTVGMLIGMVISIFKSVIIFGGIIFVYFPLLNMFYCAIGTVITGIVLAMLASVYPSRTAARMAPMDAMRVE